MNAPSDHNKSKTSAILDELLQPATQRIKHRDNVPGLIGGVTRGVIVVVRSGHASPHNGTTGDTQDNQKSKNHTAAATTGAAAGAHAERHNETQCKNRNTDNGKGLCRLEVVQPLWASLK